MRKLNTDAYRVLLCDPAACQPDVIIIVHRRFPLLSAHFTDVLQILNFCMLVAVSIIWRPSERSAMLAYSKQVRGRIHMFFMCIVIILLIESTEGARTRDVLGKSKDERGGVSYFSCWSW